MSDLEPNTRAENFWVNEGDLEPITRKEQYIKHLYDETQVVPEYPKTREEYFINKAGEELHDVTIEQLNVTENGTYSEAGKAYSPVIVEVPEPTLISKSISENGTYQASSDNADGYSIVDVNVEGYKISEVSGLPSPIASFSDGANLPMPKLEVSIEPVQSGSGDPSPTNIRPISGWSAVDVTVADDITNKSFFDGLLNGTYGVVDLGSLTWNHSSQNRSISNAIANIIKKPATQTSLANILTSNGYTQVTSNTSLGINGQFAISQSGEMIFYYDGVDEPKGYMVYELATPTTPTITPTELNQLYEEFGINGSTITIQLGDTYYGGTLDVVSGVLTLTDGFISSYNGETLPSTWISDRDVYAEGTTPTIGAEVVYELATPTTFYTQPTAIKSLNGMNNLWADTGDVLEASYFESL